MIACLLSLLFGVLILFGVFGGANGSYPTDTLYDDGYAAFGSDFYTYVNNNAAATASAVRAASRNVISQSKLIKNISGLTFMGVGFIGFFAFGMAAVDGFSIKSAMTKLKGTGSSSSSSYQTKPAEPAPEIAATDSKVVFEYDEHVPYWCGSCGHKGPYPGACPNCSSGVKKYNPDYNV